MRLKYKIKCAILIYIFLFTIVCHADEFKKSIIIDEVKYWKIMNPVTGIQKIVDDSGKTIVKTESGVNYTDKYHDGRQESVNFVIINGQYRPYFFVSDDSECTYYDKSGKKLSYKEKNSLYINQVFNTSNNSSNLNQATIDALEKLAYSMGAKSDTKENIIITNDKADFGPNYDMFKYKNEMTKTIPINKVYTNDFRIEKGLDGEYIFKCTKYNYEYQGVKEFRITDGVDQVSYCVCMDGMYLHIDDDGKPAILVYSSYFEDFITLINKDYILIGENFIIKRSRQPHEYGQIMPNKPRLLFYGDIEEFENNDKSITDVKTVKLGDNYYFIRYSKYDKDYYNEKQVYYLYDTTGKQVKNAELRDSMILLPKDNKKYDLYNVDGKLIDKDLNSNFIKQLDEYNCVYDEFDDYYIYQKERDKYVIIDREGNVKIDDIDYKASNIHGHLDNDQGDKYLMMFIDGKNKLYDKNCNAIVEQQDGRRFDVSGKGTYYLINQSEYKGEKSSWDIYNMHGKRIIHYDKPPCEYYKDNIMYGYSPSTIYDYMRYYLGRIDEFDHDEHEDFSVYTMGTNQWDDINVDYPEFCFEEENGNLIIFDNGKYSLYDINGNKLLDNYKLLAAYDEDYLIYVKGFKYGLVDRKGNEKFSFSIFEGMTDDE